MKDDKFFWDYAKEPGLKLNKNYLKPPNDSPLVSIITSYYNANEFMWQTINCVLNQTFPYWEWIVVDDGSSKKEAVEYLKEVEKIDPRIKIYHKENEGLAKGRDYAIKYSTTNYILPLDADDLIEPTYIEVLYWSLETNKNASWAFSNSLGFGKYIYLVDHKFDSEKMKTENQITATALIRKEKILELDGYGVAKRYVNEDWHLWLRMLAKGDYPVQATFYGFWYRRRKESLITQINDDKKAENQLRLRDLKIEAEKITNKVEPVVYPRKETEAENLDLEWDNSLETGNTILYVIEDTGIDKKLYKEIKNKSLDKDIIIITLEDFGHSHYALRQKYEEFATVFNLPTFLDVKYFEGFINYIIKTRKIEEIYTQQKYEKLKVFENKKVKEIEYNESKIEYKLMIIKYKLKHTVFGRAIRKFIRIASKRD